jgi:two-component system nitrate/nitrite response regulator NarP
MSDAILLVDDDAVALRTVGGHLEQQGFEVARELDAAGAMAACDRLEPDVAVLDLGVPAGDGPDLLSLLRQRGIPVIGVLDAPDDSAATQALRRGADHVLVRGASPELLAATVARVADHTAAARGGSHFLPAFR